MERQKQLCGECKPKRGERQNATQHPYSLQTSAEEIHLVRETTPAEGTQ